MNPNRDGKDNQFEKIKYPYHKKVVDLDVPNHKLESHTPRGAIDDQSDVAKGKYFNQNNNYGYENSNGDFKKNAANLTENMDQESVSELNPIYNNMDNYIQSNPLYNCVKLEDGARKYLIEIEHSMSMPRRFKDFLDLSDGIKEQYLDIRSKLQIIDTLLCLTALVTIILSVVDNLDVVTKYNVFEETFIITGSNNTMRFIVIFFNIFGIILIIRRYFSLLEIHKIKLGSIADKDNLNDARLLLYMILEILLHLIFIPPFTDSYFTWTGSIKVVYNYSLFYNTAILSTLPIFPIDNLTTGNSTMNNSSLGNSTINNSNNNPSPIPTNPLSNNSLSVLLFYNISTIITFIILIRVYHFFRLIYTFSYYATPRANSICRLMNAKADVTFAVRSYLRIRPFISLILALCFIILIFGVATQLFEYYNSGIMNMLDENNNSFVQTMHKFSNLYNSLWLILVTMTTIGYGDIYPTTYLGRAVAILACIVGTFILSLLVVFLNNNITFDDVEKVVYNQVKQEKTNPLYIRRGAARLIGNLLRYNYATKQYPDATGLYRLYLWIDMKYVSKKFKIDRIKYKKYEVDLDGILDGIKYNVDNGIKPMRIALENFHKNRLEIDNTADNLKDSNIISEKLMKNTMQTWNLLKILNKDKYLSGLRTIEEMYDSQVNVIEEILYYHNYKDKLVNNVFNSSQVISVDSSTMSDMENDESPNINNQKVAQYRDDKKSESGV